MNRPSMLEEEITEKVIELIATEYGLEADEITQDSRLVSNLGLDSLDITELQLRLEMIFNGSMSNNGWNEKIEQNPNEPTVRDVIACVVKLNPPSPPYANE